MTAPTLPRQAARPAPSGGGQGVGIVHLAAAGLVLAVGFGTGAAALSGSSSPAPTGGSARALGKEMAAKRGWTGPQWTCLNLLWTHESGWRADAANPGSDARGIPQDINGWRDYPPDDAAAQIKWGLDYIAGRYTNPCNAWSFEMSHTPNWY